jgi:hypothetical protein
VRLADLWRNFAREPMQFVRFFAWSSEIQTLAHATPQDHKK